MKDEDKTKEQLMNELMELRQRVAELKASETECRRAEEALRESERRYRLLAEHATDVIWTMDMDLRFTYLSPSVTDMLGYSVEEAMAQTLEEVLTPASLEVAGKALAEALAVAEPKDQLELELNRKDGSTVWTEVKIAFLRDPDGRPVGILGVARDITERKRAEEALRRAHDELEIRVQERTAELTKVNEELRIEIAERKRAEGALGESEEKYRRFFKTAKDCAFITSKEGTWLDMSDSAPEFFGYESKEELQKVRIPDLYENPADREAHIQEIEQRGFIKDYPVNLWKKDGSITNTLITSVPVEDETGNVIAFQGTIRDITERKRAEEEIRQRTAQLEALRQMGLEITAELDLDSLLRSIVSRAIELVGGASGGFDLYQPDRDVLEWTAAVGSNMALLGTVLHRGEGVSGRVWETGEPLIVDDYQHWEGRAAIWEEYSITGIVGVPVRWSGEFLGTLIVHADPPRTFSPADAALLGLFANQAAIAIQNARLYEEAQGRAERLAAVNRIARAVGATLDLDELMETVYQEVASIFQADAFFIALYDEVTNELDFRLRVDEGIREPPARRPLEAGLTSLVVAEKKPLFIRDLEQERDRFPSPEMWGTMKLPSSWLGVPMLIGERLIGVICVQDYRPRAYGEDEELLLSTIADQVAVAIEQARLYEAEREQRELAESLEKAAAVVSGTLEPDQVLDRILEQVSRVVPNDATNIMLIEGDQVRAVRWRGYERFDADDLFSTLVLDFSELHGFQQMAESREPMVIPDVTTYPGWVQVHEWLHSYAGAPIIVHGEAIGFLSVDSATPGFFTQSHAETLRAFAGHAAAAIENARLFEAERERSTQLGAVAKVAERIASILNPDELLRETVELITQTFGYYYAAIMLLDAEANELVFNVGAGGYAGRTPAGFRQKVKEGMVGWAAHLGETIWANDVSQEPRYIPAYLPETRSELDVPLKYHDRVIGVLDLQSKELNAFTRHDVMAMETLAGHVTAALENARLYEESQRRLREVNSLLEVSRNVTSTLELDEVLRRVIETAIATIGPAEKGTLHLLDEEWEELVVRASVGFSPETIAMSHFKPGEGYTGWVFAHRQPLIVGDVKADPRTKPIDLPDVHEEKSALCVPLVVQDRTIGTLTLDNVTRYDAFIPEHLDLLTIFASQATIAIENARLYEQAQQEIAERKLAEEELRQRQLQLSVLNRMGRALAGTFELARIYRIAYEHVAQLVDCPNFGVSLYDPPTRTLRAEFMLDDGELIDAARFPPMVMDAKPTQGRVRAIATRQPEIITDYPAVLEKATDRGVRVGVSEDEHDTGAAMYVPMVARGQVTGLLEVQSYRLNAYSAEHAALLGPVANQIGLSIQNAQLYEEAQRELAERKRAEEELRQSFEKLQIALEGTINVLVSAIEMKDPYTAGHQRRVARLACAVAQEMGLPQEQIGGIRMAGLIHDLGKINIPAEILSKPSQLNEFEWGMIKAHSQVGYDILKTIDFPWPVAQIVLQHHERMNGSGYPQGLWGEEIMLEARILAVADVVEAMASFRPYRPLRGLDKALEEISQNGGVLYDPEAVDACLKLFTEKGFEFE